MEGLELRKNDGKFVGDELGAELGAYEGSKLRYNVGEMLGS